MEMCDSHSELSLSFLHAFPMPCGGSTDGHNDDDADDDDDDDDDDTGQPLLLKYGCIRG